MPRIQALPFVPGLARGVLHHGLAAVPGDALLVVDYRELAGLADAPAGLIVVDAAPLSHPMIRVLAKGIPTVMIGKDQLASLDSGQEWLLDGGSGLLVTPDEPLSAAPLPVAGRTAVAGTPVNTADGIAIHLRASVSDLQGAGHALRAGATAIGLLRTEDLVPSTGELPDADFFEQAIGALCEAVAPLPVTVRLLDLAPDKGGAVPGDIAGAGSRLGLQGVRLYGEATIARTVQAQLQALSRLASRYPLAVLIPYVSSSEELRYWQAVIRARLPASVAVGAMAETPAAALEVRALLATADFVALGCNDLMQCLFGADRDLPQVAHLLDPYSPAIFRFLAQVAELAGGKVGQLQLCGLLPQYPGVLPVLLGQGYRRFSVEPALLEGLAQVVAKADTHAAQVLAGGVCLATSAGAVRRRLGLPADRPWMQPAAQGGTLWQ